MKPRNLTKRILAGVGVVVFAVQIFAAKEPPKQRTFNPIIHKVIEYALPEESSVSSYSADYSKAMGNASLGEFSASASPGVVLGMTYYDQQHLNTTGRMVGVGRNISGSDTNTFVHFTWMTGSLPSPDGRTGAYIYGDLGTSMFSSGVHLTLGWAGFFNIDVTPDNRAVISGHYSPDGNTSNYAPTVWYDSAALAGNFIYVSSISDTLWQWANPYTGGDAATLWPHMAFQTTPSGSHVTHLTGATAGASKILYYYRKEGNTSNLAGGELSSCPTLAVTGWDCPWVYDTAWATVALVTASKQSGKVALTWTANLPDYTLTPGCDTCSVNESLGSLRNQYENDVYFQTSHNYGLSWNPMQNVTHNDAATANWMPWNDIDALWDNNDDLHIAWVASDWKRYREDEQIYFGARLYHWTESFGNAITDINGSTSRVVAVRNEDPILCNPGAFNMNLSKPQLSECNGNLYCLFVDLWDGHNDPANPDCSKRGYDGDFNGAVNGELMVSISDNNGVSFDLPHNLTNTPTPNCDSVGGVVGPCDSDHWPSMPPKGFALSSIDDITFWTKVSPRPQQTYPAVPGSEWLPIMYINDMDPGIEGFDNSTIRGSSERTFLMACVDPDQIGWGPEPCYGLGPDIGWPTYVNPEEQSDVIRVLENVGNSPVSYNLATEEDTGPSGWLTVSPISGSIVPSSMNKDTVTIHLNTGGIINSEAIVSGRIILVEVGSFDACTLNVELIVSNGEILLVDIDTVSTGVLSLAVANNGQFGMGGDAGVSCVRMDYFCSPVECDTVDTILGNTEYYMYDGSIIVGGIVNGDTILSQQIYSQGFQEESSIYPLTPVTPPTHVGVLQYWRSGILTNHDTTIGMEISYYAPQVTAQWGTQVGKTWHADQQFITREFKVWSMDALPHEGLAVGEVIDWDIPSDSGSDNKGECDVSTGLLYCIGGEYNQDDATECQENSDRYGGMAFSYLKAYWDHDNLEASPKKWTIIDSIGYGGYHESNARYVYPGWKDNELYANMARYPGLNPWAHSNPDSQQIDLHSVLTYAFNYDLMPGDTVVSYAVLTTVLQDQFRSNRIRYFASKGRNFTHYFGCCRGTRGDVNGDGAECNILDLTFQIDRMFRGGLVSTCMGEADVNSDKAPGDILDLTFMVDRIFRGGPPPHSCSSAPLLR